MMKNKEKIKEAKENYLEICLRTIGDNTGKFFNNEDMVQSFVQSKLYNKSTTEISEIIGTSKSDAEYNISRANVIVRTKLPKLLQLIDKFEKDPLSFLSKNLSKEAELKAEREAEIPLFRKIRDAHLNKNIKLTPKELKVTELFIKGLINKEIQKDAGISQSNLSRTRGIILGKFEEMKQVPKDAKENYKQQFLEIIDKNQDKFPEGRDKIIKTYILHEVEKKTNPEIEQDLNLSDHSVPSYLSKAKRTVREQIPELTALKKQFEKEPLSFSFCQPCEARLSAHGTIEAAIVNINTQKAH